MMERDRSFPEEYFYWFRGEEPPKPVEQEPAKEEPVKQGPVAEEAPQGPVAEEVPQAPVEEVPREPAAEEAPREPDLRDGPTVPEGIFLAFPGLPEPVPSVGDRIYLFLTLTGELQLGPYLEGERLLTLWRDPSGWYMTTGSSHDIWYDGRWLLRDRTVPVSGGTQAAVRDLVGFQILM